VGNLRLWLREASREGSRRSRVVLVRFVELREEDDIHEALRLMREGWDLASASREGNKWVYLLGRKLIMGLDYDEETSTYKKA